MGRAEIIGENGEILSSVNRREPYGDYTCASRIATIAHTRLEEEEDAAYFLVEGGSYFLLPGQSFLTEGRPILTLTHHSGT